MSSAHIEVTHCTGSRECILLVVVLLLFVELQTFTFVHFIAAMRLSADLCQAHDDFFLRGILALPILSSNATAQISATYNAPPVLRNNYPGQLFISFGVFVQGWQTLLLLLLLCVCGGLLSLRVSLLACDSHAVSREVFVEYTRLWTTEGREKLIPPAEGFIANTLPHWKTSLNLPCKLFVQSVGCRPMIEVSDATHAIFKAQRDGISFTVAEKIKNMLL